MLMEGRMASTEERLARLEEHVHEQSKWFTALRGDIRHLEERFDLRFADELRVRVRVSWRPRPLRPEPETSRDRLERWLALLVAVLQIVMAYVILTTIRLAVAHRGT
jgi:hypothetical protein